MPRIKHEIDFLGNRNIMFAISAVLIAISLIALGVRGLNLGIEFQGGTSIAFNNTGDITIEQMRSAFDDAGITDAVVQTVTSNGEAGFLVRTTETDPDTAAATATTVADALGISTDSYQVTTIGPEWGADIMRSSLTAFIVSLVAIIIYIAIRFEFKMGVMAVVSLLHDLIIVVGVYAVFGREVTPNTVAALLTILGYSLYDTVVVFHRIVDNAEHAQLQCSLMRMANHSINQVFVRTVNTTLSSLIPVLIMLFFGGDTLKDFAFAMTIGLVCGSYSSIAIATPFYVFWKDREPKYAKLKKRFPNDIPPSYGKNKGHLLPLGTEFMPVPVAATAGAAEDAPAAAAAENAARAAGSAAAKADHAAEEVKKDAAASASDAAAPASGAEAKEEKPAAKAAAGKASNAAKAPADAGKGGNAKPRSNKRAGKAKPKAVPASSDTSKGAPAQDAAAEK